MWFFESGDLIIYMNFLISFNLRFKELIDKALVRCSHDFQLKRHDLITIT